MSKLFYASEAPHLGIPQRHLLMIHYQAGEEGQWLKSNMKDFKYRAETKGDEDFVQMMEELDTRDDLKKMLK